MCTQGRVESCKVPQQSTQAPSKEVHCSPMGQRAQHTEAKQVKVICRWNWESGYQFIMDSTNLQLSY